MPLSITFERSLRNFSLTSILTCGQSSIPLFILHASPFLWARQLETRLAGKPHCTTNSKISILIITITILWSPRIWTRFYYKELLVMVKKIISIIIISKIDNTMKCYQLHIHVDSRFPKPVVLSDWNWKSSVFGMKDNNTMINLKTIGNYHRKHTPDQ